jgi:hypothetical protein
MRRTGAKGHTDMDARTRSQLIHAVTEYDRRQSKRPGHNPYAIAHYCGAVQNVETAVDGGMDLRAAIMDSFNGRLCDWVLKSVNLPTMTKDEARWN